MLEALLVGFISADKSLFDFTSPKYFCSWFHVSIRTRVQYFHEPKVLSMNKAFYPEAESIIDGMPAHRWIMLYHERLCSRKFHDPPVMCNTIVGQSGKTS